MSDIKKETPENRAPEDKETPASDVYSLASGAKRPDPTRYGDWEINGKCVDF